jgi:hypothetical protein
LQANDAERFVRVWVKDGEMLFTGTIRLTDDSRFSLSGKSYESPFQHIFKIMTTLTVFVNFIFKDSNTSLVLQNSGAEDSGEYECRSTDF